MNNGEAPFNDLPDLPPDIDLDNPLILKGNLKASRLLAELKGYCQTLPNPNILINTIIIQESKDSSAIENIVLEGNVWKITLLVSSFGSQIKEIEINATTGNIIEWHEVYHQNNCVLIDYLDNKLQMCGQTENIKNICQLVGTWQIDENAVLEYQLKGIPLGVCMNHFNYDQKNHNAFIK